jgi:hypothetical protein
MADGTRSKAYGPGLLGPLEGPERKPTEKHAAKLEEQRLADAMERYEENRVLAEKLEKERDEAIGEEELARRKAAVDKIREKQLDNVLKMAEFLKALKEKKGGSSRKKTKRSKKTKRRSARK